MSQPRYTVIPRTLCLLRRGDRWLLFRRGPDRRLWPNLHSGIGGHVEEGEGILAAARRELREEAGVQAASLRLVGVIHEMEASQGVAVFVFAGQAASADVRPCAEGTPVWATLEEALCLPLVADLPLILRRVLAMGPHDPPFLARSRLDAAGNPILVFEDD